MRLKENFNSLKINKKIMIILSFISIICILSLGIFAITQNEIRGLGMYILTALVSFPITIWSFTATLNDVSCAPELLKIKATVPEDKKVDAYFDYLEEKNFSLMAPFVCLIVTILSFFIYTPSIKKIIEWNPDLHICLKIFLYSLMILCILLILINTIKWFKISKGRFAYSMFCFLLLIGSLVASFFSNTALLIFVISLLIGTCYKNLFILFKKIKKKTE